MAEKLLLSSYGIVRPNENIIIIYNTRVGGRFTLSMLNKSQKIIPLRVRGVGLELPI